MKTEQFLIELQELCKKYDAEIEEANESVCITVENEETRFYSIINKDVVIDVTYD